MTYRLCEASLLEELAATSLRIGMDRCAIVALYRDNKVAHKYLGVKSGSGPSKSMIADSEISSATNDKYQVGT